MLPFHDNELTQTTGGGQRIKRSASGLGNVTVFVRAPGFLYAVIEANLIHRQNNKVNRSLDPDSGGTQLFITPGLQYVTRRWIVETAIQIPIEQNLNGTELKNDYIGRLSARFNF